MKNILNILILLKELDILEEVIKVVLKIHYQTYLVYVLN